MSLDLKAKEGCCEEASPMSRNFYVPCNAPATCHVAPIRGGEGPFRMCRRCGEHNVRNRGFMYVPKTFPQLSREHNQPSVA